MRAKKTIDVEKMLDYANEQLARTDEFATNKFKAGIALMIEQMLHKTGNYLGYNNIYWLKQGFQEWQAAGQPDFPEKDKYVYGEGGKEGNMGEYARFYYKSYKLDRG